MIRKQEAVMFCRFVHCVSLALKSPYEERGQLSMYCIVLYCIVLHDAKKSGSMAVCDKVC